MKNNTQASRYEMMVGEYMAIADYQLRDGKLYITHVEVPSELRGQGIAAKLMENIVREVNAKKISIVPICSYAASYLKRNPQ